MENGKNSRELSFDFGDGFLAKISREIKSGKNKCLNKINDEGRT